MIEDLHRVAASKNLCTKDMFPHTYQYAQTQGFSEEQFLAIAKGKFHMPYEICSSASVMRDVKSPPTPDQFASVLRGTTGLTAIEMKEFSDIWQILDIQDLFHLQTIYVACDTTHLADCLVYYLNELHRITGLWPSHFITLASQALTSALYNCNDPKYPTQKIFLPFLSSEIYQKFEQALIGGYSVNAAYFSYFNMGFTEKDNSLSDTITSASLVDFNGLYPSALQCQLPYRNFVLLQKEDNNLQFRYISKQLKDMNMKFFVDKATHEKTSFLFEVILDYNFEDSLGNSLDLGIFPYFRKVANTELTRDQQDVLDELSRHCDREPAKLISAHRNNHHVTDFVDNIAYLVYLHSCRIVEVLSIVSFETAPFLQRYVQQLQDERSRSPSTILARIIKNLSNSIPGKLHQRIETFTHCQVATNKEKFLQLARNSNFLDFRCLGPEAAIAIKDGLAVPCRNLPAISAKVYSFSKLLLWQAFLFIAAKMSKLSQSYIRLAMSDTDSLFLSYQRRRTELEQLEITSLLASKKDIEFHRSLTCMSLATAFVQTFGRLLDWSSVDNEDSYVLNTVISMDPSLRYQIEYLSTQTKNQPYKIKEESGCQLLESIVASSAKQHLVTMFPTTARFPTRRGNPVILTKKIKGVPRSRHNQVSIADFTNVAILNKPPRVLITASFKKTCFQIYLVKTRRKLLSRFSVKRLYSERYRTKYSFFSFPLNWKSRIIK